MRLKLAFFYNLNFGGAKRAMFEQVNGLIKRGHQVDVYTTDTTIDIFTPNKIATNFISHQFNTHRLKIPVVSRLIDDYLTLQRLDRLHKSIAAQIDAKQYDLVIAHPDKMTQAPLLLQYLTTKSVYYSQEPLRICYEYLLQLSEEYPLANKLYEKFFRNIRKKVDQNSVRSATHQLTSCYHVRERMIEAYGVFPDISYLGIDAEVLKPQPVKEKNQVLFVGNVDNPIDNYELAEAAIALIPKKIRPRLVTVQWKNENNERLTDTELAELYSSSITTLCLSKLETFGLVPLESMACATAPIATRVSGHRETVSDGKTGFLVEFKPKDVAEKIIYLLKNPQQRKKMGKSARKHVLTEWNWTKRIDELEDHLVEYVATQD